MTQEWVTQFNKKCAEFMGWENSIGSEYYTTTMWGGCGFTPFHMKFHSDWNWIMKVKNKICQLKEVDEFNSSYDSVAKGYRCAILPSYKNSFDYIYSQVFEKEIEAYIAVINKFINWYNKHKNDYKENWNPDWKGDPDDPNRWKGW